MTELLTNSSLMLLSNMQRNMLFINAAVVTSVNTDQIFTVLFFKCSKKIYFIFDENDHDEVGTTYLKNFHHVEVNKN